MQPILQFGTSRFLQAHVDLFVAEAMERGEALGGITVVQTTTNAQSTERVQALSRGEPYPVRIRGLQAGVTINVSSVRMNSRLRINMLTPQFMELQDGGCQTRVRS